MHNQIRQKRIFDALDLTDAAAVSTPVDINRQRPDGYFSCQLRVTGAGSVTVSAEGSLDGVNFVPLDGCTVFETFGASSGPNADGHGLAGYYPPPVRHLRYRAVATGTVNISAVHCNQ